MSLKVSARPVAILVALLVTAGGIWPGVAAARDDSGLELETVIVTASFREAQLLETPASVTILDESLLEQAGEQHFEELINLVPNLNWSGGTSRPRYVQVRGIGERSQYQGAPDPSVGFIVDDIDFSGIGMVATLFDLQQIEVLRGPQGTRYGANALAGLIHLRSQAPTEVFSGRVSVDAGGDDTRAAGVVLSGPTGDSEIAPDFRLVLHNYKSDGFRDNAFLDRDDTNGRDETTARLKLRWDHSDTLTTELTLMMVDLDNGYDAFAIDNSLTTLSDKPGRDAQDSRAAALRFEWSGAENFTLQSISTIADSDITFSFDGDWGNNPGWAPFDPYDFFSGTVRERRTYSQELRFISEPGAEIFGGRSAWVAGVYAQRLEESNDNEDFFNDALFTRLRSDYQATSTALFGQLDTPFDETTTLTTGLRLEHRRARYTDSNATDFAPSETMLGGQVTLGRQLNEELHGYLGVARGFKAGGFNIGTQIPAERRVFDAEFLWNFEAGIKGFWPDRGLSASLGAFFMLRRDQQVSTSFQDDPSDPLSFTFFNDNAASGRNFGLEADFNWRVNDRWRVFGSLGLLRTRFDEYVTATRVLDGREQAHAPSYTFSAGGEFRHPHGFYARLDVTGKDSFYYSDSHDQRSPSYELVNARLGWARDRWDVYAWGRNLFDEVYTVRGFFFGNEPPDFPDKLYTRQGDPRVAGIGVDYRF